MRHLQKLQMPRFDMPPPCRISISGRDRKFCLALRLYLGEAEVQAACQNNSPASSDSLGCSVPTRYLYYSPFNKFLGYFLHYHDTGCAGELGFFHVFFQKGKCICSSGEKLLEMTWFSIAVGFLKQNISCVVHLFWRQPRAWTGTVRLMVGT